METGDEDGSETGLVMKNGKKSAGFDASLTLDYRDKKKGNNSTIQNIEYLKQEQVINKCNSLSNCISKFPCHC